MYFRNFLLYLSRKEGGRLVNIYGNNKQVKSISWGQRWRGCRMISVSLKFYPGWADRVLNH